MIEIHIAKPCDQTWTAMKGDERVRHCLGCRKNVYNIAQMTEAEVGELIRATEGKFCARVYRRTDGRVLTKDCPRGVALVRRRTLAVSAAMTLVAGFALFPAMGQPRVRHRKATMPDAERPTPRKVRPPEMTMGIVSRPQVVMGAPAVVDVRMGDVVVIPKRTP